MATTSEIVSRINTLTASWAAEVADRNSGANFALSGAGIWPLLAVLATGADEQTRRELETAIGPGMADPTSVRSVLDLLAGIPDVAAALAVWVRPTVQLRPEWSGALPPAVVHELSGQLELDEWAATSTRGLIPTFPLQIDDGTRIVLATALALKTVWTQPFRADIQTGQLVRSTPGLQTISALRGDITVLRVVVEGAGGVDVHLLLGPAGAALSVVLQVGCLALTDPATPESGVDIGEQVPGVTFTKTISWTPGDRTVLHTPPFDIRTRLDLADHLSTLGLVSAFTQGAGHFPGMAVEPLMVSSGVQQTVARFDAVGFEAASVTAMAMRAGSAMPTESYETVTAEVTIDRPFAFLAVHRETGLVVFAGGAGE